MPAAIKKIGVGIYKLARLFNRIQKILICIFFWVVVIIAASFLLSSRPPQVPARAALVLNPAGDVVEQLSDDPINFISDMGEKEVLIKDLLDAINIAKDDKRIEAVVLHTGGMGSIGMSKLLDIKNALDEFKMSGKKVIATADEYNQADYFLASGADEIYMHPMGRLIIRGFSQFRRYYREGLDKLDVDVHVFRVGEYKSAVEPFLRNDMSEEAKKANLEFINDLWALWLEECAKDRGLKIEDINNYISNFKNAVSENRGDMAKVALDAKLIDKIAARDEVRERMIELVGRNDKTLTFNQIDFSDYLASARKEPRIDNLKNNIIAVITAKGEIFDGIRPPGEIGGDSTAALIRKARQDSSIKAIVLRVDSPGGSAFASEIIREECESARNDGIPVIVSMGSVAASGGYWISMASDEIWASPATITGSIGVFGMFPTLDKTLSKYLGIHVDGVGTTPLAGIDRYDRPFTPELGVIYQQSVNRIYDDFISKVASSRNMEKDAVDVIARGRVWSGQDALEAGLVDKLGDINDAVAAAAVRAGLEKEYQVKYINPELSQKERLMRAISGRVKSVIRADNNVKDHPGELLKVLKETARHADFLLKMNDPNAVYAWCPFEISQ